MVSEYTVPAILPSRLGSEIEARVQLNLTRRSAGAGNGHSSKVRVIDIGARHGITCVIQDIEGLEPYVERHPLGDMHLLDQVQLQVLVLLRAKILILVKPFHVLFLF